MAKERYEDAYDSNMQILNAGDKGSGLQNDVFADSTRTGYDNAKYFRAEGAKKTFPVGQYKIVFGNPASKASFVSASNTLIANLKNGAVLYNYGIAHPSNPNYCKVIVDSKDGYVVKSLFRFLQPITNVNEIKTQATLLHSNQSSEGLQELNDYGAKVLDKAAVVIAYKSVVSNANDLKKAINAKDMASALAYTKNAKRDLDTLESLLK